MPRVTHYSILFTKFKWLVPLKIRNVIYISKSFGPYHNVFWHVFDIVP